MALNKIDHDTFRHYLLGKLAGDDLETFEKRLLTDDEVFEELAAAEDDLIDEYAAGDLSRDDRDKFEKHFLITSGRQEDVDFARTLRNFIQKKPTPIPRPWHIARHQAWISRVAAILVVSVVAFLGYQIYTSRAPRNIATVTLTPSVATRGDEVQATETEVNLRDKDALRIHLKLPEDSTPAPNYRAELIGDTRATVNVIDHNAESVTVQISASDLPSGEYALRLYARDTAGSEQRIPGGSYLFNVK